MKITVSSMYFVFATAMAICASPAWAEDAFRQVATTSSVGLPAATCATSSQNGYDENCTRYPDADTWPTSCDQAARQILAEMTKENKKRVKESSYQALIQFHRGWGTGIRNSFGLWRGNLALTESCMASRKDASHHPDGISMIIIQEVWKQLQ